MVDWTRQIVLIGRVYRYTKIIVILPRESTREFLVSVEPITHNGFLLLALHS